MIIILAGFNLAYEQCTIWLMNSVLMNLAYEQCAIWHMNSVMNLAYEQCAISAPCMHALMYVRCAKMHMRIIM